MTEQDDSLAALIPQVEVWPASAYDALVAQLDEPEQPVPELGALFSRTRRAAARLGQIVHRR